VAVDLAAKGVKVEYLSGESVRDIFPETGFDREQREEHIRRVGYLASRLEKSGVFVVASFVSPFTESREFVRGLCQNFIEIHVATPLEACEQRDRTGLYARARRGEVQHVVGLDEPYQAPERPHLRLDIRTMTPAEASAQVLDLLSHHF
jgi:adenylylsulfate kinase